MTTFTFDSSGRIEADFSAVTEVNFVWSAWPFNSVIFEFYNVSQSVAQALISMRVSTNGGSSYDSTGTNYKTAGISKWTEGIVELANMTEGQWPISIDMGDATAYGNSGDVVLKTPGTAGGNNVNSFYEARIARTDSGNNMLLADQRGFYVGAAGSRINAAKIFFPDMTYSPTMSGKIIARGVL